MTRTTSDATRALNPPTPDRQLLPRRTNWQSSPTSSGPELFDLPNALRPVSGTSAPAPFLPELDNGDFEHRDRTRIVSEDDTRHFWTDFEALPVHLSDSAPGGPPPTRSTAKPLEIRPVSSAATRPGHRCRRARRSHRYGSDRGPCLRARGS